MAVRRVLPRSFQAEVVPCHRVLGARRTHGIQRLRASAASRDDGAGAQCDHVSSRAVPLTNGQAFWLLDPLQDRYFNVHGQSFIIQRPEAFTKIFPKLRQRQLHKRTTGLVPVQPAVDAEGSSQQCTAIIRPTPSPANTLLPTVWSHEPAIDITDRLEQMDGAIEDGGAGDDVVAAAGSAGGLVAAVAPSTSGGLVPVANPQQSEDEGEVLGEGDGEQEVYVGSSSSPRRTKMIGFTCLRCNARSYKPINPLSFEEGTLVVQCGKCGNWHKIKDHLGLFHELQGDVFVRPPPISMDDIPPSLRMPLAPFYWQDEEGAGGADGGDTREGR
mmetsp:Transcript_78563/g.159724  ORF Transcript_78563/g.159724 Transcript_78563/m.159724 type:complete len:329 (+) Transcript_78563:20-1006(+)